MDRTLDDRRHSPSCAGWTAACSGYARESGLRLSGSLPTLGGDSGKGQLFARRHRLSSASRRRWPTAVWNKRHRYRDFRGSISSRRLASG